MQLKELVRKTDASPIVLALLWIGALAGGYLYVVHPTLMLLRIMLAAGIVYLLFSQHQQHSKIYYFTLLYFTVYTIETIIVTQIYGATNTKGDYVNFLSIAPLVLVTLAIGCRNPRRTLKLFYWLCLTYVPLMGVMGIVEHITGWHLPLSGSFNGSPEIASLPTGLSYNPNDYSVLIALALIFVWAYRRKFVSQNKLWIDIVYGVIGSSAFIFAKCRAGLVVEVLMICYMFRGAFRKYWKGVLAAAIILIAGASAYLIRHDHTIIYRIHLYAGAFQSLFDSWGMGFGILGDQHYFGMQDDRSLYRGYVNAHSYLTQILLTSGLVIFIAYIALIASLMHNMAKGGRNEFWMMPMAYLLLLFSPSSSLFLWGQYLFFAIIVCYASYIAENQETTTYGAPKI